MAADIHALMQDAHDDDLTGVVDAEKQQVRTDRVFLAARTYLDRATFSGSVSERLAGVADGADVTVGLVQAVAFS